MSLTKEWKARLDAWRKELPRHFYRPLGQLQLAGAATMDHLTVEQARRLEFAPLPAGAAWGSKWQYCWFRAEFTIPAAALGQRLVLRPDVGWEALVFVDGQPAAARDHQHVETPLLTQAGPDDIGRKFEIMIEGYAGHGPTVCHAGPTPPDRLTVPEPGPAQRTIGENSFGIWDEELFQLWSDVESLYTMREALEPLSLRVAEVDAALRQFTLTVDFELPYDQMMATARLARRQLQPLLECRNGSTVPTMFAFGHAHIDCAWLWPLAETDRKVARTFSNQLALMADYPTYCFLQSQPYLYHVAQRLYPALYERIKRAVAEGQIAADGAMWVEADTNVTGGESLVRQMIHGKRFFRQEFGRESEMLWLPDVFGYSGALPQIMRGCGVKYFSTAKIFWNYHGGDPFPYNTFTWEGIDGSEVLVHLTNDYNSALDPGTTIKRWNERVQKDGLATRMMPFGWGDGGGGPTRIHLEFARRQGDLEGVPRVRMAAPAEFFHDLERRGGTENRYVGELYYQCHRGTLTSQARTKLGNRRGELWLREAEMWTALAAATTKDATAPYAELDEAWKKILLCQFHDILPGSSIHRVYEESEAMQAEAIKTAESATVAALATLVATGGAKAEANAAPSAITLFNSLNWPRSVLVPLPEGWSGAATVSGAAAPTQTDDEKTKAEVTLPSCGWTTLRRQDSAAAAASAAATGHAVTAALTANGATTATAATPAKPGQPPIVATMENEFLRIAVDGLGRLVSIFDKESGRDWAEAPCNEFRMFRDTPTLFDAWDIDSMAELTPVALEEWADVEVVSAGPLVAVLRVRRLLTKESGLSQTISLRRGSRLIHFKTNVEWHERHKLLKVAFPVTVHADEAIHEIQFGHLRRPTHRSRPFDADRFEVANHKWTALSEEGRGVAILNDCKYGVNVLGRTIGLTLLRSPLAPDMTADQGRQVFKYAFTAWNGSFLESDVVRQGYELNCYPTACWSGDGGERSMLEIDAANVVIETVKPSEKVYEAACGAGLKNRGKPFVASGREVIVRLYEAKRTATRCRLRTSLPLAAVEETDMLERSGRPVPVEGGHAVMLDFKPFEIKTLRLTIDEVGVVRQPGRDSQRLTAKTKETD